MAHPENQDAGLTLACPSCGHVLTANTEETLKCMSNHVFTVPDLLINQSIQAGALINSGLVFLEQQVKVVRALALEHSISKPDLFLQLETQADKLEKIVEGIREAIRDEWSEDGNQSL
jgi:hypothetical protein